MLLSPSALASRLHASDWVVFDCRHDLLKPDYGRAAYAQGHVPGAHFASLDTALSGPKNPPLGRHPLPSAEALESFFRQHGVSASTQVVAYDDAGGAYAARLWWLARWLGLTRVALLDGGWPAWVRAGLPASTSTPSLPAPATASYPIGQMALRHTAEVEAAIPLGSALVIDARAPERYRGDVEPMDPQAGHIPGALNRFFRTNLTPEGCFRPAAELRQEFLAQLGERTPNAVIHQCGSGVTACHNLFAMELAGLPGSALYAGSWSAWVHGGTRPVVTGPNP